MDTLRSRTIKLAHQNPSLRPLLLPILKEAASVEAKCPECKEWHPAVKKGDGATLRVHDGPGGLRCSGSKETVTSEKSIRAQQKEAAKAPERTEEDETEQKVKKAVLDVIRRLGVGDVQDPVFNGKKVEGFYVRKGLPKDGDLPGPEYDKRQEVDLKKAKDALEKGLSSVSSAIKKWDVKGEKKGGVTVTVTLK